MSSENRSSVVVLWFRHGLRLHDNPPLLECIEYCRNNGGKLLPIFIFDGYSAGTNICGYNRMKFLLDALEDLDCKFRKLGGRLNCLQGQPDEIFLFLKQTLEISLIAFEQDCEPIWYNRDEKVKVICDKLGIKCIEKISHTLYDPRKVIAANGGMQPLTYQMFLHTVQTIGLPPYPVADANWARIQFQSLGEDQFSQFKILKKIPTPEYFDIYTDFESQGILWHGGETQGIQNLNDRLATEELAFCNGFYLPNQSTIDILGESKSLSPHLRFGCLSIRRFYWSIHKLHEKIQKKIGDKYLIPPSGSHLTGQLIWREYFYTMSVNNPFYAEMKANPICINIPWRKPKLEELNRWKMGQTGFPLIDAAMRQLLTEGWIHHILRNTVASFLTRGALWLSWEYGVQHFLKYLLDADWSVCAGNWMWVSSSAFENLLDSTSCTCPTVLARRLDPDGVYISKYVPELRKIPIQHIHEPWKAPVEVQESVGCIIGKNYPERIIDFEIASKQNNLAMSSFREAMLINGEPPHCRPSNDEEIRQFFWVTEM